MPPSPAPPAITAGRRPTPTGPGLAAHLQRYHVRAWVGRGGGMFVYSGSPLEPRRLGQPGNGYVDA